MSEEKKKCKTCKEEKLKKAFYAHYTNKDRLFSSCKECLAKKASTEEQKPRLRKYKDDYAKRIPDKRKAHYLLSNAIRDKRLFKTPCEVCGKKQVEAHQKQVEAQQKQDAAIIMMLQNGLDKNLIAKQLELPIEYIESLVNKL